MWELLQHNEVVDQLFHISGHGEILRTLKPTNIEELACALAIIRPGKRYLLNESWAKIKEEVWKKPLSDQYYFKKAHAVSYAAAVVVHLNLLCENTI
jgi:DNA polymerase III alpha subunit